MLPFEIKPVPRDHVAAANSLIDLGCSPDDLQEARVRGQRATHSFIKLNTLRIALASSGKRKRPP